MHLWFTPHLTSATIIHDVLNSDVRQLEIEHGVQLFLPFRQQHRVPFRPLEFSLDISTVIGKTRSVPARGKGLLDVLVPGHGHEPLVENLPEKT